MLYYIIWIVFSVSIILVTLLHFIMLCVALESLSQSGSLHTATTFFSLQVSTQPLKWLKSWKRLSLSPYFPLTRCNRFH